jgi:hypothetical protein
VVAAATAVGQRGKPGHAMLWIEAQWTTVIALLVFGLCYMLTAAIFCLAAILSRRAVARGLKVVVQVVPPLGMILGLLIGFLADRVWSNFDRANQYVGQEAGALRETILLTNALPPDVRTAVRKAVKKHLDFMESEEWPAMASGRATLQSIAVALAEAMTALLSFTPAQSNQQLAQQRALVAIEQALEARRNRVLLSQAEIAPIQWIAIIVIAVLILITLAMVLIEQRLATAITMFIYSTAVAICLVLLLVYDRRLGPAVLLFNRKCFRRSARGSQIKALG